MTTAPTAGRTPATTTGRSIWSSSSPPPCRATSCSGTPPGSATWGSAKPWPPRTPAPDGSGPSSYRTGLVAQGRTFAEAAGTAAHELGHTLFGLPDLYNVAYLSQEEPRDPAGDSAGIGNWGLMGWGALGWGGDDGPAGFSAWSRLRLGWAQVTEAASASQRILLRDVAETGELVRIPLGGEEYFLLEYRTRSSFYDRGIPAEGLLVWHVMGNPTGDVTRAHWVVDLECADGRWTGGRIPSRPDRPTPSTAATTSTSGPTTTRTPNPMPATSATPPTSSVRAGARRSRSPRTPTRPTARAAAPAPSPPSR